MTDRLILPEAAERREELLTAIALSIVERQGMTNRDRAKAVLDTIEAEGWTLTPRPREDRP